MRIFFGKTLFSLLFAFMLAGNSWAQDDSTDLLASDAVNMEAKSSPAFVSPTDYSVVDAYATGLKRHYKKIPELAKDLTANYSTDEEKVRAIFMWITNNIAYDYAQLHSKQSMNVKFTYKTQAELDQKRKAYYDAYATKVLRNKKGICEGYAVLFQELCTASGIPCEIAVGRVSNNTNKIERVRGKKNFATNHAWDKVKISGTWYYVDPTWASGYCDKDLKKFYKNFNAYYYLTPLDKLYATHAENKKETEKRNNVVVKIK